MAIDVLARLPLAPLLALQGLMVRRKTPLLPEPPGPRSGTSGDGPLLRLLIVGDSSAAGVGAPTQNAALSGRLVAALAQDFHVDWRLEAATGDTTHDALSRLSGQLPRRFDVVVSALGVNDVTRLRSYSRWMAEQSALIRMATDTFGARAMVLSGLPPMGHYPTLPQPLRWIIGSHAKRLDLGLARLAETQDRISHLALDLPFEPRFMAEDGYHPSPAAYDLWAGMLASRIRDMLGVTSATGATPAP